MSSAELQASIGREKVQEAVLDVLPARRMLALLDRPPDALSEGSPLPGGWHWLYAHTLARRSQWGADGHARLGSFLPAIPQSRRMWAGGSLRFLQPLHIGDRIEHRATILDVEEKQGRNGTFVLTRVGHRIAGPAGVAIEEEQNLVYLPLTAPPARNAGSALTQATDWQESFVTDEVLLFYFSALTMNGHRIHYDQPFATTVEGYPGLLVHAPLTALLLLDAAQRHGRSALTEFSYRATAPLFCGDTITLTGRHGDGIGSMDLWCLRPDGAAAMQASST